MLSSGFCHFCFFEISISLLLLMDLCFYCEMTRCDFILCLFLLVLTSCLTLASFKNFFLFRLCQVLVAAMWDL